VVDDLDLSKFETRLESPRKTKEQDVFERVLASAISADRQGLFLETQVILDQDATLTREQVELVWASSKFQRSLADRGIKTTQNPNLTLRQETFLQAYLNPLNLLTPQVLAKRMKISLNEIDGWMRQKEFAAAMAAKSEDNLKKYIPMADAALGQLIQQGDMKAITFVNQLTGRFDPNAKQNIDIQAILMSIQDIIARHVREPEVKRNIAREIIALANGQSPMSTLQEPTQPSVESKAETITVIPEE
jgi:hypothetical protein